MVLNIINLLFRPQCLVWLLALAGAISSSAATVKPYRVPKEQTASNQAPLLVARPAEPPLTYKAPSNWEEVDPGEMRAASFKVKGKGGQVADVSIIPLPGFAGSDLDNVNRWRAQVGLGPVDAAQLGKLAEKLQVSGTEAQLFDLAGQREGASDKSRILAAIQRRDNVVCFYKMTGEDSLVRQQKSAFLTFLKSIKFNPNAMAGNAGLPPSHPPIDETASGLGAGMPALPASHPPIGGAGSNAMPAGLPPSHPPIDTTRNRGSAEGSPALPASHPPMGNAATPPGTPGAKGSKPSWKVPASWKEQPAGPMQVARFLATGDSGTKGEASVASIPGDGGGMLGNVNRWRRQIGLNPIEEAELANQVSTLDLGTGKGTVLDVTSADKTKRLIAVSVPRDKDTWFYKLMGDETVVAREKDAFLQFVKSAQ